MSMGRIQCGPGACRLACSRPRLATQFSHASGGSVSFDTWLQSSGDPRTSGTPPRLGCAESEGGRHCVSWNPARLLRPQTKSFDTLRLVSCRLSCCTRLHAKIPRCRKGREGPVRLTDAACVATTNATPSSWACNRGSTFAAGKTVCASRLLTAGLPTRTYYTQLVVITQ
ncbi:hypothetical protein LX36DRAFT_230484 [Colletotrichum falcatum]|nr:hypothetical protein LX36DRAFT_230484 [Colletotrichum falcatum]